MTLQLYEVTVPGYGSAHFYAESPAAAKAAAYHNDAFSHLTFCDFLKLEPSARLSAVPTPDGYDYVRRRYELDIRVGDRVRIKNEGPRWNGREGVVLYPGPHTAHVRALMDEAGYPSWIHPRSIDVMRHD